MHICTQIRMKEFDQAVKFFIRNIVNECICAHAKVFKLYRDEELESLSVLRLGMSVPMNNTWMGESVNLCSSARVHMCTRFNADGAARIVVILYTRERSHMCTRAHTK